MYTTTSVQAIGGEPAFMDAAYDTHVAMLTGVKRAMEAGANAVVVTHLYGLTIPENRKSPRSSQTKAFFCWKIAHKPRALPLLASARGPSVTPSALALPDQKPRRLGRRWRYRHQLGYHCAADCAADCAMAPVRLVIEVLRGNGRRQKQPPGRNASRHPLRVPAASGRR